MLGFALGAGLGFDAGVPDPSAMPSLCGALLPADQWSASESTLDLWLVRLGPVDGAAQSVLSADEVERAARQHPLGGSTFAASRVALRSVLSRYVGREPESLGFRYGEHGRPALGDDSGIDFNLSHSGELALIAVGTGLRTGVDLQRVEGARDLSGLARRFFAPDEVAALRGLEGDALARAFFRTWTCKEAYLKGLGTSIAVLPPAKFCFRFDDGPARLAQTAWPGGAEGWQVAVLGAPAGYAAAVCWTGGLRSVRAFELGAVA